MKIQNTKSIEQPSCQYYPCQKKSRTKKSQLSHFQQVTSSNTLPCSQQTVIVNKENVILPSIDIYCQKCSQNDKLT